MIDEILSMLKKGDFVSGSVISRELGISRTAVWKYICKLREQGYDIQSVTNKGYMLSKENDVLNKCEIQEKLKTKYMGRNLLIYDEVSSTNLAAKEKNNMPDGTVFVADMQSSGRGRLGRVWESAKGEGLWFSVLLKPDMTPEHVSLITLIAGLAVCETLGSGYFIKWPNDIVTDGKKICGILTELSAEIDHVEYVVCGIGINVNNAEFSEELREKATSLLIKTGKKYIRNHLLADILNCFEVLYDELVKNGFSSIIERYKKKCITIGKQVSVMGKACPVIGLARDITESGALVISCGGKRLEVNSGEVSVRGIYGYI